MKQTTSFVLLLFFALLGCVYLYVTQHTGFEESVIHDTANSSLLHDENSSENYHEQDFIQVHHADRVPNFARNFTVITKQSGKWSDPSIWSTGQVPGEGDTVVIYTEHRVEYDVATDSMIDAVAVAGQLTFSSDKVTHLSVTHLLVYPSGKLTIGSIDKPILDQVSASIVINDRPINTHLKDARFYDPAQYGNGILVWGELLIYGADKGLPISRLQSSVQGNDETLKLSVPDRWKTGDQILLPDTRQPNVIKSDILTESAMHKDNARFKAAAQLETRLIQGISKNSITLSEPVSHSHGGVQSDELKPDYDRLLPHVANISRNVTIRSANPKGVRGHTVAFHNSQINIQNAKFQDLGRTTIAKIDNTKFDGSGDVVHVGQNQVARYPVHMHHINNPSTIDDRKPTFVVRRNVIAGAKRWSMSVHGSHYGLIEENIAFDVDGAGFVTEDGSETGNKFLRNFVAGVHGSGLKIDARERGEGVGHEGSGFWLGSDNNQLVGNVVAGVRASGFALFRTENSEPLPSFPKISSEGRFNTPREFRFEANEVYSAAEHGVRLWSTKDCDFCKAMPALIEDTKVWNSAHGVMFDYHADYYVFDGLTLVGTNLDGSVGVLANHSKYAEVRDANIVNFDVGVETGGLRNKGFTLKDSQLQAATGIMILTPTSWGRAKNIKIDNVKFLPVKRDKPEIHIEFGSSDYGKRREKISIKRPVFVYNYQQEQGLDYQVFKFEQAPSYQLAKSGDKALGCPEAGLTNTECLERHKVSYGGEIATCETIIEGISGFTCTTKKRG